MKYSLTIQLWGFVVLITSNNRDVITTISSLKHVSGIPIQQFIHCTSLDNCVCLHVEDSPKTSLTFQKKTNTLILCIKWVTINNQISTITNLLGQLLSLACWNHGEYPIHSSAVMHDQKTYLFVGGPNCGKTTLSMTLCLQHGFKLLANDWSAVSNEGKQIRIVKGHDLVNFSMLGYEQLISYIDKPISNKIKSLFDDCHDVDTKSKFFTNSELNISQGSLPSKIDFVFFINIVPISHSYLKKLPALQYTSKLLKEFIWPLRGCGSFVIDNKGLACCASAVLNTPSGWDGVCEITNLFTTQCECFQLHSSLDEAVQFITKDFG